MDGKFISFEGPDGAGKTSVIQQIQRELEVHLEGHQRSFGCGPKLRGGAGPVP